MRQLVVYYYEGPWEYVRQNDDMLREIVEAGWMHLLAPVIRSSILSPAQEFDHRFQRRFVKLPGLNP